MPIRNILQKALVEIEAVAWRFNPDQFATWLENRNTMLSWIQQVDSSTSLATNTEVNQQELVTCEICGPAVADADVVSLPYPSDGVSPAAISDMSTQYDSASVEFSYARPPPRPESRLRDPCFQLQHGDPARDLVLLYESDYANGINVAIYHPGSTPTNALRSAQIPRIQQVPESGIQAERRSDMINEAIYRILTNVESSEVPPSCTHIIDRLAELNCHDATNEIGPVVRNFADRPQSCIVTVTGLLNFMYPFLF
ncbi:hypothetical protein R1flu_001218 [Riccia fluitans]|uniref:Uncharacterized protein n=1 Tax=Riccia fluitans TaxID=41844 RepID=A0ABD1Y2M9_9MARC